MERRAFICTHSDCVPPQRRFMPEGAEASCPDHGKRWMVRQRNVPYVKPDPTSNVIGSGKPVPRPKRRAPKRPAR